MTGWRFPPFSGSSVEIRYPVVFAPSGSDASNVENQLNEKVAHLSSTEPAEYTAALGPSPSPEAAPGAASSEVASAPPAPVAPPVVPPAVAPPPPVAVAPEAPVVVPKKKPHRHRVNLASVPPPKPSLLDRVQDALHSRKGLNRVKAFTSGDTVTLYGRVFDDPTRLMAERTVRDVPGVANVNNTLTTDTSVWTQEQNQINREMQNAGLGKVTAKVIGRSAYLDGEVTTSAERDRAVTIAESAAPVRVRTNLIRVVPKGLFGF